MYLLVFVSHFHWINSQWSRVAGSYGGSPFNFLRNLLAVFHSGFTNSHFYYQCMRVSFSPYPCQHFCFPIFLMIAILTDVRWSLTVVVICNSLMINHVEHLLFMCLLATCGSSFGKCLFGYCVNFLNRVLFFLILSISFLICAFLTLSMKNRSIQKKIFMAQITTMVWSLTQSQTSGV